MSLAVLPPGFGVALPALAAFLLTLAVTPLVRAVAHRVGAIARPKTDRWHKKPTAMLGGVAIWLSVVAVALAFVPTARATWAVVGTSTFLFVLGLVDDVLHIKPYQKLIGQVLGAATLVYFGVSRPWTGVEPVDVAITIFWLIGITNAVNMLDNMDGLSAGIAAIASGCLAVMFLTSGAHTEAVLAATLGAALVGFLVYNSNPASIFMGDCGSMFIGFFLATISLLRTTGAGSPRFLPIIAVPVLILFVPIFDTTLVTVLRKVAGRAASQGGRDHTSHRLVALGLTERQAVLMLYGFAAVSGLLAVLVGDLQFDVSLAAIAVFTIALTLLGVYLGKVKVYEDEADTGPDGKKPLYAFLVGHIYKRRVFEVMLDVLLVILAYWGAHATKFGPMSGSTEWELFLRTLPLLVIVKMTTFLATGVYRGAWRYTGMSDLGVFARASVLASVACVLVLLFAFRFDGFSRVAFALDSLYTFVLVAGSRLAFRVFRNIFPVGPARSGRRVLIYGAGDAGELTLRELLNNSSLQYNPIGFVDDDPSKRGSVIHGYRVFGGNGALRDVCRTHDIAEVLISSRRFDERRIAEILAVCEEEGVRLTRMRIGIEDVARPRDARGGAPLEPRRWADGGDFDAEPVHALVPTRARGETPADGAGTAWRVYGTSNVSARGAVDGTADA